MVRWIVGVGGAVAAIGALVVAGVANSLEASWWVVALIGGSGLAAAVGTYLHLAYGRPEGVALLWVAAAVLIAMSVLAIFSIGIFLFPAAVAAAAGAIAATRRSAGGSTA